MWLHRRLDAGLSILENVSAGFAACAAVLAMVLVSADAVMRHLFARPLEFQFYLTENYLLVAILLLALPWGYRTGGLVRISGLIEALPVRPAIVLQRVGLAAAALYIGYLAVLGWRAFHAAWLKGEVEMGVIDWPVAWSHLLVPIGTGLLALRLGVDALAPAPFGRAPVSEEG